MTTRVQKGSAVFRPAKARTRSSGTPMRSSSVSASGQAESISQASETQTSSTTVEVAQSHSQPPNSVESAPASQSGPAPPALASSNSATPKANGSSFLPSISSATIICSLKRPSTTIPNRNNESFDDLNYELHSTPAVNDEGKDDYVPQDGGGSKEYKTDSALALLPYTSSPPATDSDHFVASGASTTLTEIPEPSGEGAEPNSTAVPSSDRQDATGEQQDSEAVEPRSPSAPATPSKKRKRSADFKPSRPRRAKRSRTISQEEVVSGDEDVAASDKSSSPSKRGRRKRPPPPPFDPEADPGEELDPTVVTMAVLCDDTGQGRVSSKAMEILNNHTAWKAQSRAKRARMREMAEKKKFGRQESDDEGASGPSNAVQKDVAGQTSSDNNAAAGSSERNGFDYTQDLAANRYHVQIRIGPNGETLIDETSLVVEREEEPNTEGYAHVVESDHTKFVNSGTYGKRFRGSRWSAEETELFYDALSQYGENYEMISLFLPGRDRKACKNKFKTEDKRNRARIEHCLRNRIPIDMERLSRLTGKDFSGPVPDIPVPAVIKAPPASSTPAAADKEPHGNAATSSKASRRRSRSRSRVPSEPDGVEIIGNVDTFAEDKD